MKPDPMSLPDPAHSAEPISAACPADQELLGLLAELDAGNAASVFARQHVTECASCQARLAALTDDAELRDWRARSAGEPEFTQEAGLRELMARVTAAQDTPRAGDTSPAPALGPDHLSSGEPTVLDQYRLVRRIATGGMGVVYEAVDVELRRSVAIKIVRSDRADEAAHRALLREARVAAGLRHPNLVTVHAVHSRADSGTFLVMELVRGESLAVTLKREGTLACRDAAEILARTADGLAAAHASGLLHGDLKPSNILLDTPSETAPWLPRLTDFGVARAIQPTALTTIYHGAAGTPSYMSPEQLLTPDLMDLRSDIYSLGVTLYECLTGQVPFRGTTQAVLHQIVHVDPPPPSQLNELIPLDLQTICQKAMAREMAFRYATAAEFAADLRRWLRDEPIHARPLSTIHKLYRACRRQPLTAALIASLAILVPTALVLITALWMSARGESRRANSLLGESQLAQQAAESARQSATHEATRAQGAFRDSFQAIHLLQQLFRLRSQGQAISQDDLTAQGKLVQQLFEYYQQILREPLTDVALRREAADDCFEMGLLGMEARVPGLIEAMELAGGVYEELSDLTPMDDGLVQQAGKSRMVTGQLWYQQGEFAKAAEMFSRSRDAFTALALAQPQDAARQRNVIAANGNLAAAHMQLGRRAEAEAAYRGILTALQTLRDHEPENVVYAFDLAKTWYNLAMLQEPEPRLVSLQACLSLRKAADRQDPNNPITMRLLGRTEVAIGECQAALNDRTGALESMQRGFDALAKSAELQPLNMETQIGIAECELARSRLWTAAQDAGGARGSLERAITSCRNVLAVNADDAQARQLLEEAQREFSQLAP